PEPDFYEMKAVFAGESVDFDPSQINMKQVRDIMKDPQNREKPLSTAELRVYRMMLDHSGNLFKDLKRVARHYIEVGDIKTDHLYDVSHENLESIFHWIK